MDKLRYGKCASEWGEALPLGNGYTGVMIYGSLQKETLSFNDCTLWSGYPSCDDKENGFKYLEQVRELIFAGKNRKADLLAEKELFGGWSTTYLPLGDIYLEFNGLNQDNYKRELDLANGIHTVSSNVVKCEAFASYPKKLVAYKLNSENEFSVKLSANSPLNSQVTIDDGLNLFGNAPDKIIPLNHGDTDTVRYNEHKAMAFALRVEIQTDGTITYNNDNIYVSNATELTLYCVTSTGFKAFNEMPETDADVVVNKCKNTLKDLDKDYNAIKLEHIKDFNDLYNRQSLKICQECDLDTDEIIKVARNGGDLDVLSQLMYNFGKYLLISGSRKGTQPLNLQGIWNSLVRPPWSSNYTTNINTEMNYWCASACGLNECIEPLIRMVDEAMITGSHTAKEIFGADGFCCNHNMDIWRKTSPSKGSARFILSPLCGSWLTNELYKHYLNGGLDEYKDKIFEIVKENAKFIMSFLVLHDGKYVICPATSPENAFRHKFSVASLDYATAYDMAIARESLIFALDCTEDEQEKSKIQDIINNLYPLQKGRHGIREYHKDYIEFEFGHRHFSHLYAFYPSQEIGYYTDPERTEWIRKSFWRRLKYSHQHIGWSAVWAMCIGARLRDVNVQKKVIRHFITNTIFDNLFCFHQPSHFQIDGNFGFVAGLNEILITEENNKIELLPAILPEYKTGYMKNIIIKSAKISFKWENSKVTEIESDKPIAVYNKHLSDNVVLNENVSLCDC